jgi:hypothetical protein
MLAIAADPNAPAWLAFGILAMLGFISFWAWRSRRLRSRVFASHQFEEPTLAEIQNRLDAISKEGPTFSFAAERRANILFSGQQISIVYGPVVSSVTTSNKAVYAVADAEQSHWMRQNSDVFEPAFSGSQDSIFWVNIAELLRQLKN